VMRALYRTYYQQKKRGFTDAEFRAACESAAGTSLAEVFDYAATTKEMDYTKYFAYAGLIVNATSSEGKGVWLGANVQARDNGLFVTDVIAGSPAAQAGLHIGDLLTAVEGSAKPTVKQLNDTLAAKHPGDHLKVQTSARSFDVELSAAPQLTYSIKPMDSPTAQQGATLKSWL